MMLRMTVGSRVLFLSHEMVQPVCRRLLIRAHQFDIFRLMF